MESSTPFNLCRQNFKPRRRRIAMPANGKYDGNRQMHTEPKLNQAEDGSQRALAEQCLQQEWATNPRWEGVERPYTAADVLRLRGSVHIEHTLARMGAERLWEILHSDSYVNALGAMSGNQAVQQVQAGLKA